MSLTNEIARLTGEASALTARVASWLDEADARWQQVQQQLQQSVVLDNITLEVGPGKQFAALQDAWNHIASAHLRGWVTIQVAPGVHEIAGALHLGHQPWGAHVRILGDVADLANCVLRFVPDANGQVHGIVISNTYLELSGFQVQAAAANTAAGLMASAGAYVYAQPGTLAINSFQEGVIARGNATVRADRVVVTGCERGLNAYRMGSIIASEATIVGRGRNVGFGAMASESSLIATYGAHVSACGVGIAAQTGGYVWCDGSEVEDCDIGFFGGAGGLLWCYQNGGPHPIGQARNCGTGWWAERGIIVAPGGIAEGCTTGYRATSAAYLQINESAAHSCQTGYQAERMALIEAWDTQANLSGNTTDYALAHGTPGNYGAMILYS